MIKIVVDSTGYIPQEIIEKYDIKVVPLKVRFGNVEFKETDISVEEFYRRLTSSTELPKTSQPSPQDFMEVYKPLIDEGHEIISIHLSQKISGTINSARVAIELLKTNKIRIVDSMSTTFSLRFLAEFALSLIEKGLPFEEVYKETVNAVNRIYNRFVLYHLKYLVEGGRLSKAGGLLGDILNIKPILSFTNGEVKIESVARSLNKAKDVLLKFIKEISDTKGIDRLAIIHGINSDVKEFEEKLKESVNVPIEKMLCGAVIGVYAGPEWIGVGIFGKT
ncbi:DegV family protein [Caldisericum exile]|uniref:DegV family protein n=1 Tax=Caldisericum exile TaxID=693075 RepID=UPI003C796B59